MDPTSDSQDEMNLEDVEDVCLPSSVAQSQLCYYVPHDGDLRSTDSTPDLFVSRGTQTLTKISSVGTQYEAISTDLISKTAKILAEKHFGTNVTRTNKFIETYTHFVTSIIRLIKTDNE